MSKDTPENRLTKLETWAWGPNQNNGVDLSIKGLWAVVRRIDRTIMTASGAMIIVQPLVLAALVKWLVGK